MKIDLTTIPEGLCQDKVIIAGEVCTFVHPPKDFFDWEESNLHLRSSIWNAEGELISAGFKKFFNFSL